MAFRQRAVNRYEGVGGGGGGCGFGNMLQPHNLNEGSRMLYQETDHTLMPS